MICEIVYECYIWKGRNRPWPILRHPSVRLGGLIATTENLTEVRQCYYKKWDKSSRCPIDTCQNTYILFVTSSFRIV